MCLVFNVFTENLKNLKKKKKIFYQKLLNILPAFQ